MPGALAFYVDSAAALSRLPRDVGRVRICPVGNVDYSLKTVTEYKCVCGLVSRVHDATPDVDVDPIIEGAFATPVCRGCGAVLAPQSVAETCTSIKYPNPQAGRSAIFGHDATTGGCRYE